MKYLYLCLGFIMAGIVGLAFIVLFQNITVNNESEYYVLKEAMEAAMLESVDMTCYRLPKSTDLENKCGNEFIKISEQKFVENFTRRFAESISGNVNNYRIEFFDIMESPPKATIVVKAITDGGALETSFSIVNNLDGILEYSSNISGGTSVSGIEDSDLNISTEELRTEERIENTETDSSNGESPEKQSGQPEITDEEIKEAEQTIEEDMQTLENSQSTESETNNNETVESEKSNNE